MVMRPHPRSPSLLAASRRLLTSAVPFNAILYRAVAPKYAASLDVLSGEGAKKHGGRWNPLGVKLSGLVESDWRAANDEGDESLSQALGRAAFEAGWEGMILPSARSTHGRIAVIFPGHLGRGSRIWVLEG